MAGYGLLQEDGGLWQLHGHHLSSVQLPLMGSQHSLGSAFWLQHWGHRQCNLSPGCRSGGSTGMQAQVCTLVHAYIHFLLCALLQLQTSLEVGGGKA